MSTLTMTGISALVDTTARCGMAAPYLIGGPPSTHWNETG